MSDLKVGDIVARKSYGGDVHFVIVDVRTEGNGKPVYVLRGLMYRIKADSHGEDLVKQDPRMAILNMQRHLAGARNHATRSNNQKKFFFFNRFTARPGKILHIDSSGEYLQMCLDHYRKAKLSPIGYKADESEQPGMVRRLLERYRPDILVVTGHDSMKKGADRSNMNSYLNSKYYIQSVKEARGYEPSLDKLCVFAGACQSYFEALMQSGANFASSPGRILINALDPAFVSEKIALTDSKTIVTPQEVADLTISGRDGIGGTDTKGHLIML